MFFKHIFHQHQIAAADKLTQSQVYEFPLSERVRVFMRMEQLFLQLEHFMAGESTWNTRSAISCLLDILTIFNRNELKSDILKELDRHATALSGIAQNQNVDTSKLEELVEHINSISKQLYSTSGRMGLSLLENELFKSISQRSTIPGGTYSFDLPEYHFWLQQAPERRTEDMTRWLRPFSPVREGLKLIMQLIRQSSVPSDEIAEAGFFQQALPKNQPFQLLRILLPREQTSFADISGGKHRFTVRFMEFNVDERSRQSSERIPFKLELCRFG